MLQYLGTGERDYGRKPVPLYSRSLWQFQAVLRGRIRPILTKGETTELHAHHLWLFPPGLAHGWGGDGEPAEVAVFHYISIPEPLASVAHKHRYLAIELSGSTCDELRGLAREASAHLRQPQPYSALHHHALLSRLCLIIANGLAPAVAPTTDDRDVVATSMAWFDTHMHEAVGIDDMARAVHRSPAHLRRLFHAIRECSPQEAITTLRMERASKLLVGDRSLTIAAIATACGLSCASALTRAFTNHFGMSPRAWREANRKGRHGTGPTNR